MLQSIESTPLAYKRLLMTKIHRVALALDDLDKPQIVAAVNGIAVGAGMDMALLCDMRVAGRSARLSEGYIKVGLVPGDGGAWLLPRLVGPAKAMELLLTGDFVSADEALRLGIVNQVVDDEALLDQAYGLAARIVSAAPVQVAMIRRLVRQSVTMDLRTHFDLVSSHMGVVSSLEDLREAGAAFREKRPAVSSAAEIAPRSASVGQALGQECDRLAVEAIGPLDVREVAAALLHADPRAGNTRADRVGSSPLRAACRPRLRPARSGTGCSRTALCPAVPRPCGAARWGSEQTARRP